MLRAISSQALKEISLKVQRLSLLGVGQVTVRSASHPDFLFISDLGDDIVHPLEKSLDTCNRQVTGSNPVRGAYYKVKHLQGSLQSNCRDFCIVN